MSETSNINTVYKFDIIKFARDIIQEVDDVRSYTKKFQETTKESFQNPKESRINAFLRLIGLPMFVNVQKESDTRGGIGGNKMITPGYDTDVRNSLQSYTIKDADSIEGTNISKILSARESTLLRRENEIGTDKMNSAMTAAFITSPSIFLQSNFPSDKDGTGTLGKDKREVFKKLKPLITSYLEVIPKNRELARPFVPDVARVTVGSDTLSKPFIETVARIRLLSTDSAESAAGKGKVADIAATIENDLGVEAFKELFEGVSILGNPNVLESFIINKMLASIDQLANKWVEIEKAQAYIFTKVPFKIKVKSASAKLSPLGKRISIISDIELNETSEKGLLIKSLKVLIARDEALLGLMPTDETSNVTLKSGSQTKNIAKSALMNPFTSIINGDLSRHKKRLNTIENEVKKVAQTAESLRLELEMMTGEFTGLSVPDVVAVIIGLFIISKEDLLALLDKNVKDNMSKEKNLKSAITVANLLEAGDSRADAARGLAAVKNLEKVVDKVFDQITTQIKAARNKANRSPRSNQSNKKKAKSPVRVHNRTETQIARSQEPK